MDQSLKTLNPKLSRSSFPCWFTLSRVTNIRPGFSSYSPKNSIKYPINSGFLGQERITNFQRKSPFCSSSTSALQYLGKSNRKYFFMWIINSRFGGGRKQERNLWELLLWCFCKAGREEYQRWELQNSQSSGITFQELLGIWEIQWNSWKMLSSTKYIFFHL